MRVVSWTQRFATVIEMGLKSNERKNERARDRTDAAATGPFLFRILPASLSSTSTHLTRELGSEMESTSERASEQTVLTSGTPVSYLQVRRGLTEVAET